MNDPARTPTERWVLRHQKRTRGIGATPVVVGRHESCDIVIDDLLVSRRHAEFTSSRDGVTVVDLGSANGIYVQGRRLTGPTLLGDKDRIRIATHQFEILSNDQGEQRAPRSGDAYISHSRRRQKRVLFVSPDRQFTGQVARLLTESGLEATLESSLTDALSHSMPFDCAVLDAFLPGGTAEDSFRLLADAGLAEQLVVLLRCGDVQPVVDGRVCRDLSGPAGVHRAVLRVLGETSHTVPPLSGEITLRTAAVRPSGYSITPAHADTVPPSKPSED